MSTAIAHRDAPPLDSSIVAQVLLGGDLEKLNDAQRVAYATRICETLGLNALTQPFAFIRLNGKLVMYAKKDATEQLRKLHGVSITAVTSQRVDDVFVVTANAQDRTGRTDASTGAVAVGSLKGEALANALMKAETKAKRRVTLSICGLGILDETEVEPVREPEPSYTVEAEPVREPPRRIPLPTGAFQIVEAKSAQWGGEVIVVDHNGEEFFHKTTDKKLLEFCKVNRQDAVPVTLDFEEITRGVNKGKQKLVAVHLWMAPPPPPPQAAPLTADEIPF